MSKRFLIFCPSAVFVSLSLILLLRSFFSASPSKATVNLESASAVALILCWCLIAGNRQSVEHGRSGVIFTVLPLLVVPPFLITLGSPFLYDGYAQVVNASKQSFQDVVRTFYIHPTGGDFFFRPLGALDFWLESKWAGLSPVRWQLDGLLLHLSAVYLLFILCRLLDLSGQASCFASLFFGLHGTSPEVVSWTAARFDELAACFVLVTLICFCKLLDKSNWYPLMILSCLCAVLSKEAAFCVPALAICCLWYRGRLGSEGGSARTPWAAILGLAGTCGMVFVYRFWLLGGIGGYRDASGSPTILSGTGGSFRVLELLFFRMWSCCYFLSIGQPVPRFGWLLRC